MADEQESRAMIARNAHFIFGSLATRQRRGLLWGGRYMERSRRRMGRGERTSGNEKPGAGPGFHQNKVVPRSPIDGRLIGTGWSPGTG